MEAMNIEKNHLKKRTLFCYFSLKSEMWIYLPFLIEMLDFSVSQKKHDIFWHRSKSAFHYISVIKKLKELRCFPNNNNNKKKKKFEWTGSVYEINFLIKKNSPKRKTQQKPKLSHAPDCVVAFSRLMAWQIVSQFHIYAWIVCIWSINLLLLNLRHRLGNNFLLFPFFHFWNFVPHICVRHLWEEKKNRQNDTWDHRHSRLISK